MTTRGKDGGALKREMDPEEIMRRKFRAKCLFRALGRLVMANAYWLIEAVDHYEGIENVKRRIEQAVRGKMKKKQLLSINDKALLNKPAEERSEQEKQYLYRIIGGLKCFKRYPNHVKRKLAAVTYFKYYGPGRTIVRQHQEAHAMYFIVSGDVVVSHMVYDELLQQHVSVEIGSMHQGDMFGEVSLLHNIPRSATVVTNGHCELLALMKGDFKSVLQASVQKQWDEIKHAMSAFTYFDALDEVARREGCLVAKMKSYAPNDTILGDGVGVPNHVYFVLSGKCQMIESINVIVTSHLGRNYYALYDPYTPKEESEQDIDTKYFKAYKNKESRPTIESTNETSSQVTSVANIPSSPSEVGGSKQSHTREIKNRASDSKKQNVHYQKRDSKDRAMSTATTDSQLFMQPVDQMRQSSIRFSVEFPSFETTRKNIRTYFMQVCQMNPGGSFGFGENMRDRRIVALTSVNCMLMPKVWLLQRNTANIWTRIQHYLEKKIPNKKDLFKEFVKARRWQEYREQMVDDIVSRSNTVNYTTVHDVPYSIRMEEMVDI